MFRTAPGCAARGPPSPRAGAGEAPRPALVVPAECPTLLPAACHLLLLSLSPEGRFVPRWSRVLAPACLAGTLAALRLTGSAMTHPDSSWVALPLFGGMG